MWPLEPLTMYLPGIPTPIRAGTVPYLAPIGVALLITLRAAAMPTTVTVTGQGACDPLVVPSTVEELGNPSSPPFGPAGPFPPDEAIASVVSGGVEVVCRLNGGARAVVSITNLTTTAFDNLWYVADPGT